MTLSFNPSRCASPTVGFSYDSSHPWTASEENIHWGSSLVVKQIGVGTMGHFITDRLHSKDDGSAFYPYGESKTGAPGDDREQFATYTRDQSSGLDYADQRWYSSRLGRFTSPDPYKASASQRDPDSWNRYPYVRSRPIGRLDRKGLMDCPDDIEELCEEDPLIDDSPVPVLDPEPQSPYAAAPSEDDIASYLIEQYNLQNEKIKANQISNCEGFANLLALALNIDVRGFEVLNALLTTGRNGAAP